MQTSGPAPRAGGASAGNAIATAAKAVSLAARAPTDERVVLVPCSASTSRQWRALEQGLVDFRPVPLDLRGHGEAQRWHGAGPFGLSEEAAAIGRACPDGAPFHLVGHSYGGGVALWFALRFPRRIASLTLIEPSCFHLLKALPQGEAHLLDEIRAIADAVNHGVITGDYRRGIRTFIDYWGGKGSWESLSEPKKARFAELAVHVAHHFWSLIEEATPLEAYRRLSVPTLIVSGTRSPAPSRAITRLLADALPRAQHRTVANAGHMSPITHAAEVNALILDHLRSNIAPGTAGARRAAT